MDKELSNVDREEAGSTSSRLARFAANEGKLETTASPESPQNMSGDISKDNNTQLAQSAAVDGNGGVGKSWADPLNGVEQGELQKRSPSQWSVQNGDDEFKEGSSPSFVSFSGLCGTLMSSSSSEPAQNDARGTTRLSNGPTLEDILAEHGRGSLSEAYMEIRCDKFHGDHLYLDLTGRIVEEHLGRRLDDDDLAPICNFLAKNRKVIYLSLGYNSITRRGFSYLAQYLAEHYTLRTLNLSQNEIHCIDESILRSTAALWKLRCLLLRGNKLGPRGGLILARMFKYNGSLRHVDIGETEQTVQSVSHIVQSLIGGSNGNRTIQKLVLNRLVPTFQQGFVYSCHLCRLIEQLITYNHTIVELHLERNEISDWDLELMIPALGRNNILELINLTGNRLTSHGLQLLSTVLPETNIQYLILASNHIGDDGAIALGRIFGKTKIMYLDVSTNRIRDAGMKCLLWGLNAHVPPLHTLFIFGNPITKETIEVLYKQIFLEHISPYAVDIEFTFTAGSMSFAEDRTANKYRNTYYLVHELCAYKRPLHHSCCYLSPNVEKKSGRPIHLTYRSLLPPEKDYSADKRSVLASSTYYALAMAYGNKLPIEDTASLDSQN